MKQNNHKIEHLAELLEVLSKMQFIILNKGWFNLAYLVTNREYRQLQKQALTIMKSEANYPWFKGRDFITFKAVPILCQITISYVSLLCIPLAMILPIGFNQIILHFLFSMGISVDFISFAFRAVHASLVGLFMVTSTIFSTTDLAGKQYENIKAIISDLKKTNPPPVRRKR